MAGIPDIPLKKDEEFGISILCQVWPFHLESCCI